MAVVQTTNDRAGIGMSAVKDSDGYWYIPWIGGTRLYSGAGTPNGDITAPIGSRYTDTTTLGTQYVNTTGAAVWKAITQAS